MNWISGAALLVFFFLTNAEASDLPLSLKESPYEVQPAEVIEAFPSDPFTLRLHGWPTETRSNENLHTDARPFAQSLNSIPGVQARTEGSPSISVRGSHTLARVLGLYQGVPLNTRDGFGADSLLVPTENLESIHVLKGPSSVFFGADALGGAVHFVPRRHSRTTLRLNAGDFGEQGVFGALPIQTLKQFYQFTGYHLSTEGNFPYTLGRLGQSGVRKNNQKSLQRFTGFGEQKLGELRLNQNLVIAEERGNTPGSVSSPWKTESTKQSGLGSLSAQWDPSANQTATLRTYLVDRRNQSADTSGTNHYNSRRNGFSGDYQIRATTLNANLFFDLQEDFYDSSTSSPRELRQSGADLGALADWRLQDGSSVRPGLRYSFSENLFVPALGFYQEKDDVLVWATYSEAYRTPGLADRYSNTSFFQGNPSLRTEKSSQVEIGFNGGRALRYGVNVFSIDYSDLILTEDIGSGIFRPRNLTKARTKGVEGQFAYQGDIWGSNFSITHLEAQETETRRPLPFSPDFQTLFGISAMWGPLVAEVHHTYWQKYFDRSGSTDIALGPWQTVDLVFRTVGLQDWTVQVAIYNVFDAPREFSAGYPESQRRLFASVERRF